MFRHGPVVRQQSWDRDWTGSLNGLLREQRNNRKPTSPSCALLDERAGRQIFYLNGSYEKVPGGPPEFIKLIMHSTCPIMQRSVCYHSLMEKYRVVVNGTYTSRMEGD